MSAIASSGTLSYQEMFNNAASLYNTQHEKFTRILNDNLFGKFVGQLHMLKKELEKSSTPLEKKTIEDLTQRLTPVHKKMQFFTQSVVGEAQVLVDHLKQTKQSVERPPLDPATIQTLQLLYPQNIPSDFQEKTEKKLQNLVTKVDSMLIKMQALMLSLREAATLVDEIEELFAQKREAPVSSFVNPFYTWGSSQSSPQ